MSSNTERDNDYFKIIPYGIWSLETFVTYALCKDIYVDKAKAHREFYGELQRIENCGSSQAKRARELLQQKKLDIKKIRTAFDCLETNEKKRTEHPEQDLLELNFKRQRIDDFESTSTFGIPDYNSVYKYLIDIKNWYGKDIGIRPCPIKYMRPWWFRPDPAKY
ncbi:uncharacterized protein OCT59_013503 [Rhizophagus irregularis]|uniref:Uncharacterized protein n=1 Tax=Rhizophagus irregularis (strain DAOM 197198w) TaxID=1432141 RepID=A0A015M5T5_RHIIW|nr:hypothetical protein RirG_164450 [Rhizophagus irregularis DAOM 197198w]UZO21100.1 hypothetical protein OCT59_013503 [Rhizophagus irregularis]GBC45607.2 hypothetical protein GLOIN_2v1834194 [Rhizophagus irregularis DAOM 181602=DAOM 197198]